MLSGLHDLRSCVPGERIALWREILTGHRRCSGAGVLAEGPFNVVTSQIIGASIEVHRVLGPGLLESIYLECLQHELTTRRLRFLTQQSVPIVYKGTTLAVRYRIDLLVEDLVVVEVKSVDRLLPVHQAQLLTYVRLMDYPVGLLINFNVPKLVDGVSRVMRPRSRHSG